METECSGFRDHKITQCIFSIVLYSLVVHNEGIESEIKF